MKPIIKFIIKRLLQIVGVVFLLSITTFLFSINSVVDPVEIAFAKAGGDAETTAKKIELEVEMEAMRENLGYYIPNFYFKVVHLNWNSRVLTLKDKHLIDWTESLMYKGYNANDLIDYSRELKSLLRTESLRQHQDFQIEYLKNGRSESITNQLMFLTNVQSLELPNEEIRLSLEKCEQILLSAIEKKTLWKVLIPTVRFYGDNRYHRWLFGHPGTGRGFIRGDFGKSIVSGKKVLSQIKKALPWTLVLSLFSIVIAVFLSITTGVLTAYAEGGIMDKAISTLLFILYTMPSFWLATLLMMTFANPDYLNWFPSGGIAPISSFNEIPNVWERIAASGRHLILPMVCISYGSVAVLSRLTRSTSIDSIRSLYIFSARTRGLREKTIITRHVVANALLPLITVCGAILSSLFGGSVIIERIFSIPGMGNELFEATVNNDVMVVMAILTISGLLSTIGYLLSDIFYQILDPRIKLMGQ